MRTNGRWLALALAGTLTGGLFWAGCGDDDDEGPVGPQLPPSDLNFEIQSAAVPETGSPTVTFRVTDQAGAPVDLLEELDNFLATPQAEPRVRPRFSLAQLEDSGTFTHYYEVTVAGSPYEGRANALAEAIQPRTEPPSGAYPVDRFEALGNGVYRYTFSEPTTPAEKRDRTRTHRVGIWGTRVVDGEENPAVATFDFVPAGGQARQLDAVNGQACMTCHTEGIRAHDERIGYALCATCHASDQDVQYLDPDTGENIAARVMFHKIHRGANLPSVQEGDPYDIIGFRGGPPGSAVHDYSEVNFPQDIRNCTVCHSGDNGERWRTAPSASACTSCHDNVRFGEAALPACGPGGTAACNHIASVEATADCSQCHTPEAISEKHVPVTQLAEKYRFEITNVTLDAERMPVVTFRVVNTETNAAVNIKSEPEFNQPGGASRLAVDVGWPAADYRNAGPDGMGVAPYGQPITNATAVADATQNADLTYTLTLETAIPEGVTGTGTAVLEGHPATTSGVRLPVRSAIQFFPIGGGAASPRRDVVSVDKCNGCHGLLSFHGSNRNGSVQVCAVCHNPNATDGAQRPAGVSGESPIDLKWLIHVVHGSEVRANPVTIYGFGNRPHEFPLGFTGNVGDCNTCHVNDSFELPLAEAIDLGTTTDSAGSPLDYTDNVRLDAPIAVCTSCHDTVSFDDGGLPSCSAAAPGEACAHSGGTGIDGSTCATCHGPSGVAPVREVHPIR